MGRPRPSKNRVIIQSKLVLNGCHHGQKRATSPRPDLTDRDSTPPCRWWFSRRGRDGRDVGLNEVQGRDEEVVAGTTWAEPVVRGPLGAGAGVLKEKMAKRCRKV